MLYTPEQNEPGRLACRAKLRNQILYRVCLDFEARRAMMASFEGSESVNIEASDTSVQYSVVDFEERVACTVVRFRVTMSDKSVAASNYRDNSS